MSEISIDSLLQEVAEEVKRKRADKKRKSVKTQSAAAPRPVPRPAPSPWRTLAQVIPICVVVCRCGETFEVPASKDGRFLRRRNVRNGTVWEVPTPDGLINPALPVVHRRLIHEVAACHHCVPETPPASAGVQLTLSLPGPGEWGYFTLAREGADSPAPSTFTKVPWRTENHENA